MPFENGHPKYGGRKPGTPNVVTKKVRDALAKAWERAGGEEWFLELSQSEPKVFAHLVGKLLPTVQHISSDDGGPIVVIRDYTGESEEEEEEGPIDA